MRISLTFIEPAQLKQRIDKAAELVVVDVRNPEEYSGPRGHIPGARNVPIVDMPAQLSDIASATGCLVVTTCGSSGRGEKAAEIMMQNGFEQVAVLRGGLAAWSEAGFFIEGQEDSAC